jgi:hypothetical protein
MVKCTVYLIIPVYIRKTCTKYELNRITKHTIVLISTGTDGELKHISNNTTVHIANGTGVEL